MSAPIQQDELNRDDPKIYVPRKYRGIVIDAPALQPSLGVTKAPHSQSSADWTINQDNVFVADSHPEIDRNWGAIEYRGVRITAIISSIAVVAWTAVCVVLALGRLDTNKFIFLRNGLAFANDTLGERLQAANGALHKVSRHVLSPTLVASETTGVVNTELPLAIKVTNYTPGTAINLSGLVAGTTLSSGIEAGDGQWRVAIDDLPNTRVIPPPEYVGAMTIIVELRNDNDQAIVHIPLRLTWRRAVTESTGTVPNLSPAPLAADSVVNDTPKQVVSEDAMQNDVTVAPPQPESRTPLSALLRPSRSQKLAKKRRHKAPSSDAELQANVDRRMEQPPPLIGDFFANTEAARERKPVWRNDFSDIINRSWERCREPSDCSREIRR
jgi:hypothetical protein